jgi:hypothetical protein
LFQVQVDQAVNQTPKKQPPTKLNWRLFFQRLEAHAKLNKVALALAVFESRPDALVTISEVPLLTVF